MTYIKTKLIRTENYELIKNLGIKSKDKVFEENLNIGSFIYSKNKFISEFKWIKNIGTSIIENLVFKIGGNIIQKLTGEYIHIYNELYNNIIKKDLYNNITGNNDEIINPKGLFNNIYLNSKIPSATEFYTVPSIIKKQIYVPLPFWFTKDIGLSLPLICLQYDTLEIELELKPISKLYTIKENNKFISPFYKNLNESSEGHINNFVEISNLEKGWGLNAFLEGNFIYLDNEERKLFANSNHEYLIEQTNSINKENIINETNINVEIKNNIKEIIFVAQRNDIKNKNEWSNFTNFEHINLIPWNYDYIYTNVLQDNKYKYKYTNYNLIPQIKRNNKEKFVENIIREMKIVFNDLERIFINNKEYLSLVQSYQHFKNKNENIYSYSFSLDNSKYQPSGNCNLTNIKDVYFKIKTITPPQYKDVLFTPNNLNNDYIYKYNINLHIINYNILTIMNGIAKLKFKN